MKPGGSGFLIDTSILAALAPDKPDRPEAFAAWLRQHSERENFAEVQVERQHNPIFGAGAIHHIATRRTLHAQAPDVNRVVPKLLEKFDRRRRDPSVGEELHYSTAGIGCT